MYFIYELLIIVLMIILNGFFSAYEMALASITRTRLAYLVQAKEKGAVDALYMKDRMEASLAVVQLGLTLVGAIAAARDKAEGFARPAQLEGSGLGRLLQLTPGVQRRLVTCPIELLPLYATLAAISAQFDGPLTPAVFLSVTRSKGALPTSASRAR